MKHGGSPSRARHVSRIAVRTWPTWRIYTRSHGFESTRNTPNTSRWQWRARCHHSVTTYFLRGTERGTREVGTFQVCFLYFSCWNTSKCEHRSGEGFFERIFLENPSFLGGAHTRTYAHTPSANSVNFTRTARKFGDDLLKTCSKALLYFPVSLSLSVSQSLCL